MQKHQVNPQKWVSRYGDYLFSLAMLKVNHRETAEDLVQETFLSAVAHVENFRAESSEKTWLISILNRKIIDFYRKKDLLKNVSEYLAETNDAFYDSFFGKDEYSEAHWKEHSAPADWTEDENPEWIKEEFHRVFDDCVRKMPPRLAPVFLARFIDEEDSVKICKDYNISASNYWVIIHRAKLVMRACLEKNWVKK